MNVRWLRLPLVHEDLEQGQKGIRQVSTLDFDKAVFGHGDRILDDAAQRFREQFGDLKV